VTDSHTPDLSATYAAALMAMLALQEQYPVGTYTNPILGHISHVLEYARFDGGYEAR
jgi:hypothetical protein